MKKKERYSHPIHGHLINGLHSPEYRAWEGMKQRCLNSKNPRFADYGGRGIKICERWSGSRGFVNFLADMGDKPSPKKLYSLDRRRNDGNYTPRNCRWSTRSEQLLNRREHKAVGNYETEILIKELRRRGYQIRRKNAEKN